MRRHENSTGMRIQQFRCSTRFDIQYALLPAARCAAGAAAAVWCDMNVSCFPDDPRPFSPAERSGFDKRGAPEQVAHDIHLMRLDHF